MKEVRPFWMGSQLSNYDLSLAMALVASMDPVLGLVLGLESCCSPFCREPGRLRIFSWVIILTHPRIVAGLLPVTCVIIGVRK